MRRLGLVLAVAAVVAYLAGTAITGTNTVSSTTLGQQVAAITVDAKKPKPACNGITLTNLVTGGVDGGTANDLVLGLPTADNSLRGNNGNDCILGGGGDDELRGEQGTDVCIGGPGTDTFDSTCETQVQ